jgi:hypothetical protein
MTRCPRLRTVHSPDEGAGQPARCPECKGALPIPSALLLGVPTAQQPSAQEMARLDFAGALWRGRKPPQPSPWHVNTTVPPTWGIGELQAHLAERGLRLRRLSCAGNHDSERCAFLTETAQPRELVGALSCDPRQIERWHGTVKVWREDQSLDEWERASGYWLLAPPFRFFGHPEVLRRIKAALEQ